MSVNRITEIVDGIETVLLDVSETTAEEADVAAGKVFTKADGTQATGILEKGIIPNGNLEIDENGLYDVASYATATVNVGEGVSLNIAYGDTAPTDTSKLWVSGAEPNKVLSTFSVYGPNSFFASVSYDEKMRTDSAGVAVGDKYYMYAGADDSNSTRSGLRIYDTVTNQWTSTSFGTGCKYSSLAAVGTCIYAFGGYYYSNGSRSVSDIYKYDTATGSTSKLSVTGISYCKAKAVTVGTDIYLIGGANVSVYSPNSYIRVFDTITETFKSENLSLPTSLKEVSAAAIGTNIYVFGGALRSGYVNTIIVIDTLAQTVETLDVTLPFSGSNFACSAIGTNIYIVRYGEVCLFDTKTYEISTFTIGTDSSYPNSGVFNGTEIYLFNNCHVDKLAVTQSLDANSIMLQLSANKNTFKLINTDKAALEVGLQGVYRGNAEGAAEMETAFLHNGTEWVMVSEGAATYATEANSLGETMSIGTYLTEDNDKGTTVTVV